MVGHFQERSTVSLLGEWEMDKSSKTWTMIWYKHKDMLSSDRLPNHMMGTSHPARESLHIIVHE